MLLLYFLLHVQRGRTVNKDGTFVYSRVSTNSSAGSGKAVKKNVRGKVIAVADDSASSRELPPDFVRHRTLMLHPPQLVVHKSRIHGMGVYTLTPIKQGDMVIEYQVCVLHAYVSRSCFHCASTRARLSAQSLPTCASGATRSAAFLAICGSSTMNTLLMPRRRSAVAPLCVCASLF
jgi:hypothetical protein